MTHNQLVRRMATWLKNARGCSVVLAELTTKNSETPDVLGFKGFGESLLIECKTSRADFLADAKKTFRRDEISGIGDYRYFAVVGPNITIGTLDLPEGWGLLDVGERKVSEIVKPEFKNANKHAEIVMCTSVLRRLEISTAVFVRHEPEIQ